ncbi:ScpA family protein [Roseomonas sp. FDAARGOS_362]|uniref:segregation and condensation protein A n=2 Tax=unclassified Roseomonas TaxID=2617492 RepID=UPI00186938E2|nr:ScpA family protein [Roseomonas sp. FDAARGOS_362]
MAEVAVAWEYPAGQGREAAPHPGGPPVLSLEDFEGPLDFLLEMVRQQKLRLGQLSIVPLAEQFVAALEASRGQVPLERQADWLVMASELVRLKAQALLPPVPEVAGEAPGEAGEEAARQLRRWEEQAAIRAAAAWLTARPQRGIDVLGRGSGAGEAERDLPPRAAMVVAFLEATLLMLEGQGQGSAPGDIARVYRPVAPDVWTLPDALAWLRQALEEQLGEVDLLGVGAGRTPAPATPLRQRSAVANTFLAGLELARQRVVTLRQDSAFGGIRVQAVP